MAGHDVKLVCLPAEADAINRDGAVVRLPVKGRDAVEIRSKTLPGKVTADGPGAVNPGDYDLVGLAMQEPQYRSPGVRELLDAVAKAKVPCMSIMNMPPLTYLKRVPGLNADGLQVRLHRPDRVAELRSRLHDAVQPRPAGVPAAGGDGQRAAGDAADELQGGALRLRRAHADAARDAGRHRGGALGRRRRQDRAAGQAQGARQRLRAARQVGHAAHRQLSLRDQGRAAVHQGSGAHEPEESRAVYEWVRELCIKLGASPDDLVPFEKYAAAAQGLVRPSSAARALFAGAPNIERVDRLVQASPRRRGCATPSSTRR